MAVWQITPLQIWSQSGLSFPWEATITQTGDTGSMHLGPDGVGLGLTLRIYWQDLQVALQELLGYSYRDPFGGPFGTPVLRRKLPWQHPFFNQLVVKSVQSVHGEISTGNSEDNPIDLFDYGVSEGGFGRGYGTNNGPWAVFKFALITVQFFRPHYYLRTDADIIATAGPLAGYQQEWLRYVDKDWSISTQMLSRQSCQFVYSPNQGVDISSTPFVGSVGQKVSHMKCSRTWHQVPEAGIFSELEDTTPNGIPAGLFFMKTATTNPVTGYIQNASSTSGGFDANGTPANKGYQAFPLVGCVNSPIGGGAYNEAGGVDLKFLGAYMGTMLLEGIGLKPRDLQLPAYLMAIPVFTANEPISQVQYDVTMHYDIFDPPRPPDTVTSTTATAGGSVVSQAYRGHNMMPRQDAMWYMAQAQLLITTAAKVTTAFQYGDLSDAFRII